MKQFRLLSAILISGIVASSVSAQSNDGNAQGKEFGKEIGAKLEADTLQGYDPTTVPGYTGETLTQERYYDEPDGLSGDGSAVARNNEAYKAMRDSDRLRPTFEDGFVESVAERGTLIEEDPRSYLGSSEFSSAGGNCKPLPPAPGDPSYYEETCNDGLGQIEETNQCSITRDISTTPDRRVYGYFSTFLRGFGYPHDSVFEARPDCTLTGSGPIICLQGDPNNCYEPEPTNAWQCQTPVPGQTVRFTEFIPGQQTDVTDTTQCDPYSSDGNCTLIEETCVEWSEEDDPAGRYCKDTLRRYQCQGVVQRNDCSELEANPKCTYVRRECLTEDEPCSTYDLVYRCPLPGSEGEAAPQYICDDDIYCVNGECEEVADEPNDELKDALVGLNALADVNEDFDPDTLTIFTGERGTCRRAVFGLLNCCAGSSIIPIANLVYCKSDEALLESRFKLGLCHYVGSYCSKKLLACLEKKKVYCCYESKLSRIIQQQGRPQISKDWDKPKEEQCEGFTLDEFSQLDLSLMDFTEIYSDFLEAVNLPDEAELATELQTKIQEYYDSRSNGGGG